VFSPARFMVPPPEDEADDAFRSAVVRHPS
jgi:hypothetical protein